MNILNVDTSLEKMFYFHRQKNHSIFTRQVELPHRGTNAFLFNLHVKVDLVLILICSVFYLFLFFLCRLARSVAQHYLYALCAGSKLLLAWDYILESDFLQIYSITLYRPHWYINSRIYYTISLQFSLRMRCIEMLSVNVVLKQSVHWDVYLNFLWSC